VYGPAMAESTTEREVLEVPRWTEPQVRTELPGPKSRALFERFDRAAASFQAHHDEVPFVEARRSDWLVEDVDGNTFADHVSGWGADPLGPRQPEILQAVERAQREYGMECSMYVPTVESSELAIKLAAIAPDPITRVSFEVTGTAAVESGIRLAREATGRSMILAFYGQYHGESSYMAAAVSTDLSEVPAQHAQHVTGLVFAPYPNRFRAPFHAGPGPYDDEMYLDYLEEWVLLHQVEPEQIAGVLIEPVLGEGGILVPSDGFWKRLQEMCRKWGWKLILDEVQTCMGRCGTMFAAERYDIRPDILLLAKGFAAGGQPIAAVLATEGILGASNLHIGSTYAWTPAAAAGALAGIGVLERGDVFRNVMEIERIAFEELSPLVARIEQVGDVRASGALVGVEFVQDKQMIRPAPNFHRRVHEAAVRRGLLGITQWGKWVYRFQPALNMPPELFRWSCRTLAEAIEEVALDPPPEPELLIDRGEPA
jgi:4-aminobutyrate aminotransferase-like enzyme